MTRSRRLRGAARVLVAGMLLAGCAGGQPGGRGSEEACVDWVRFDTPADAAADAAFVVRGRVLEQDGSARLHGAAAHRWLLEVDAVLVPEPSPEEPDAGPAAAHTAVVPAVVGPIEVRAGDTVAVVSTPETCTPGGAYPDGDPLDPATGLAAPDGTVIVLLSTASDEPDVVDGGGVLHLVTPYQGVVAPDEDGALPATWPSP
ncbi:MAG TPA: hypothetical protein VKY86_00760 [Promicromonospora sp.]|nr:hypothetical protein [Promicromonospora sp.]